MNRTIYLILMCIAIITLTVNIILTIMEALRCYHANYHPGSIRGGSGDHEYPDRVLIGGLWYNVRWIIKGREGVLYYEEKDPN